MRKRSESNMAEWEKTRDLNAELLQALWGMWRANGLGRPSSSAADGSLRRVIPDRTGRWRRTTLYGGKGPVAAARAATGMSQAAFAKLLGVS